MNKRICPICGTINISADTLMDNWVCGICGGNVPREDPDEKTRVAMDQCNRIYEFTGVVSGDGEAFCWEVDKKTFARIMGWLPTKWDRAYFNNGQYMLYPDDFFDKKTLLQKKKVKVKIEVAEAGEC